MRTEWKDAYNEDTADEIAEAILHSYKDEFEKFLVKFTELENLEP